MTCERSLPTLLLLALPACVLEKDLGDTLDLTSAAGETDSDDPTGDGAEPTTGVPAGCPEGQAHLEPLWQVAYPPAEYDSFYSGFQTLGRLSDGRIAVPGVRGSVDDRSVALLLTAPEGQPIGPQAGAVDQAGEVYAFAIGADDEPVVLAEHATDTDAGIMKLTRFAPDMTLVSQVELPLLGVTLNFPPTLALDGDVPVVAGVAADGTSSLVAKLAPDTGAPVWQQTLAGPPDMWASHVAIGPTGAIAVGAHADFGVDTEDTLRLWLFDPAGEKLWDRVITVPRYEELNALQFAPGDQLVTLRNGEEFSARVEMLAVEAATGATRWELTVADIEGKRGAWAEDLLVDADRVTIPMTRSWMHHGIMKSADEHSFEVRTVSFAGKLLDVTQVPGVLADGGTSWVRSVRGRCGELILFREDFDPMLMAFAA